MGVLQWGRLVSNYGFVKGREQCLQSLLLLVCNILTYISSLNTWASEDSPLAQLTKELHSLYLCVIQSLWDRFPTSQYMVECLKIPPLTAKRVEV